MKFKTTLILFISFFILLALVLLFESKSKNGEDTEENLIALSSDDVQKIVFKKEAETITFQKNEEGEWLMTEPLEAKADKYEVDRLAEDFSDLKFERIVEEEPTDLEKYGIPQKEISLHFKDEEESVKILVGMENPLDNSFFAKKEGETRVVLISSSLKSLMEKSMFDFRQKDIFSFETDQVKTIGLRAKDIQWKVKKTEEEWFLKNPVEALAENSKIESILNSLSSLKAKEFVSENKAEEDIEKFGLDQPEYEVTLSLPVENQEVKFSLQKTEDKVHVTTSLSTKIIEVEDTILSELEKDAKDLREKGIADFYTWETNKVHLKIRKIGGLSPNGAVHDSVGPDRWAGRLGTVSDSVGPNGPVGPESLSLRGPGGPWQSHKNVGPDSVGPDRWAGLLGGAVPNSVGPDGLGRPESLSLRGPGGPWQSHKNVGPDSVGPDRWAGLLGTEPDSVGPDGLGGPEYLEIMVIKDEENKWFFETAEKGEADKSKIETFIRKIEGLEAVEFIDPPLKLEDYGLDKPQAEIKFWVKEDEEQVKEITILIGNEVVEKEEQEETKHVIVKNARFNYLFKVNADFLNEFPKNINDWKKQEEM